jgi:hypothetical protein
MKLYIRKNDNYTIGGLLDLGYKPNPATEIGQRQGIYVQDSYFFDLNEENLIEGINCIEDDDMFFAIAAFYSPCWDAYTDGSLWGRCPNNDKEIKGYIQGWEDHFGTGCVPHKATKEEIEKTFKVKLTYPETEKIKINDNYLLSRKTYCWQNNDIDYTNLFKDEDDRKTLQQEKTKKNDNDDLDSIEKAILEKTRQKKEERKHASSFTSVKKNTRTIKK